jgi:hypothetical protein
MKQLLFAFFLLVVSTKAVFSQWQTGTQTTSMGRWAYYKPGSSTENLGYGIRTNLAGGWAWQLVDGGDNPYFHVEYPSGKVGLGTPTPAAKLDVIGVTLTQGLRVPNRYVFGLTESAIEIEVPNTSYNAIRAVRGTQLIGTIHFFDLTWGSSLPANSAGAINLDGERAVSIGIWSDPTKVSYFRRSDGFVGIGTTSPDSKLTVKGIIHAEEVKLDLLVPGPDYVFEKNYPLLSLEDTKAYVEQNKHLPGIPSSDDMQQNGVNLLEMNMKLLEKVEELTLHLIEQKEVYANLESTLLQKIEALEKKINLPK